MTLKAICDCSTCDACGNAPGRSGYCLNCEATDSGAEGSHAQPEKNPNDHDRPHRFDVPGGMVGECLFWGCTERNPEEKITPAMHRAAPAMLEALRGCRESLEAALEHITKDGMTDEHEELYYLGIAASDNAKAAIVAAERPGDTQS